MLLNSHLATLNPENKKEPGNPTRESAEPTNLHPSFYRLAYTVQVSLCYEKRYYLKTASQPHPYFSLYSMFPCTVIPI